ncbi:MAG TPA: lipid-A-disaccharide synthase, partial [Thioalkalivibrio sp.]|nr:lipid-A-disaccharide synthase [Thioalkalivibrio sp.]
MRAPGPEVIPESPSVRATDPSPSVPAPSHIVVCAGETSGDHLGAGLVRAIRERRPEITFSGMGGETMRSAGVDTLVDVSELAVVGLWEVLVQYPRLRGLLQRMQRHLEVTRPQLLVLVDYVEFNLRLAAHARQLGIRVLFYVSPQVWAWRQGRIHRIKRRVDAMAVLFPFEEAVYREHGVPVRYVGNPLVDRVRTPERDLRTELEIGPDTPLIGLLPGSRKGELQRHWPLLVDTARCLLDARPAMHFAVPLASGITSDMLAAIASWEGLPITVVQGSEGAQEVMAASDLLLISSGTATLEAALLEAPMIVIYRMAALSHA